ncbi:MAG: YbjN domain-containing protein, partial [Anaerolineales bacterium]
GHGNRIYDLNAARPSGRRGKPIGLTPDEARALIDGVFRSYGLDPTKSTDPYGWRHLSLGSADGLAGVVEWQPGDHYLVVFAPILEIPSDLELPLGFHKLLLELNHDGTLAARFSIHDNVVYVGLTRPIRGLDEEEVDDAIRAVMTVADSYDEWLQTIVDAVLGISPLLPLSELPNIKMTPKEAHAIGIVLAACNSHGQDIFRYLMERWQRAGYTVGPSTTGIGLDIKIPPAPELLYGIAAIRPGVGEDKERRRPLIIIGWEGLRKEDVFPSEAIDKFQSTVTEITDVKVTESMAHIEVTEAFNRNSAKALLSAMRALAKTAHKPKPKPPIEWPPNLPKPDIKVGAKTLAGIQETLQACEPRVQHMYAKLIEGWNQVGGTVQCSRPGRIYLKFKSREHEFGEHREQTHLFNLAVLAAPKGKRGPSIDVAWNLGTGEDAYLGCVAEEVTRFEAVVSNLPGFEQQGAVSRLVIGETFQLEHAKALLEAMLALKAAEGEAR